MPWNECKPMDERLRFNARLLEGEKMAPLCRECAKLFVSFPVNSRRTEQAEIENLIEAANRIVESRKTHAPTVLNIARVRART